MPKDPRTANDPIKVRVKVGRYAGDVRELPKDVAQRMLKDGRAESPKKRKKKDDK